MATVPNSNQPTQSSQNLLIAPADLAAKLNDPRLAVIDVRTAQEYAEGHIPGAVNVELSLWTTQIDGVQGMLLGPEAFATLVGASGVARDSWVVLYDANWGMPAARVLWSFRRYGHAQVSVLNGGWDLWEELSLPVTREPTAPTAVVYALEDAGAGGDAQVAGLDWLQSQSGRDDLVIVDTRSPAEYAQGHLPQAVNWDWLNAVPVGEWDVLRDADELRSELAQLGITPDKEVVTYCRSGARASHTYLVLRQLGFPRVRNYDGSWLEWSLRVLGQAAH